MNWQRKGWILPLVTILALFGAALHGPLQVAAQDDPASELNIQDFEGYQRGAGRVWMGDISALLGGFETMSTPGAEAPDMSNLGLFMLTGMVAEFDSADHADAAFSDAADEIAKNLTDDVSGITLDETDGADLGDQSKTFAGNFSEEGLEGQLTMVLAQKGKYIYLGFGMGIGSDPSDAVNSLVKDMTGNEAGDGDGTFNDDGTSTGGLWDIFPSNDAEYLKGLTPMSDDDLKQDAGE